MTNPNLNKELIEVVITSYNRPQQVIELARTLNGSPLVKRCIVVDSGNNQFQPSDKITLLRSSHKNQPYQRYLGYSVATAPWLLYLDDDMEPVADWDREISELINNHNYGVYALKFVDKHTNTFLKNTENSVFKKLSKSNLIHFFRWLSGYPVLPEGVYGFNGVKGKLPTKGGKVQYVSGGAFLAQKEVLYQKFNTALFAQYEQRMGKGEDGILGYTLNKQTEVYHFPKVLFLHNDQGNSVYTRNDHQFNKLVAYSRIYLTLEYCRLNGISQLVGRLKYVNFCFWRILGLAINYILKPKGRKKAALFGFIAGFIQGLKFTTDIAAQNKFWQAETVKDSLNSGTNRS